MKKTVLIAIFGAIFLSGCGAVSYEEIMEIRGKKPSKERVIVWVKSFLRNNLKDPDSVKDLVIYDARPPQPHASSPGKYVSILGKEWVYCFEVNAKNSYGGYTGSQLHGIEVQKGRALRGGTDPFITARCGNRVIYRESGLIKY